MPWLKEPMKDARGGDTLRGVANETVIRRCPNRETYPVEDGVHLYGTLMVPNPGTGQKNMHRDTKYPEAWSPVVCHTCEVTGGTETS